MTLAKIEFIPAFSDNYIWCLSDVDGNALLVDPGDAEPALAHLKAHHLQLNAVLITHHHPDHVGGLPEILNACGDIPVYGPQNHCETINHRVAGGDSVQLLGSTFEVIAVPGHTLDHIAYYLRAEDSENNTPALFCGDTLFAGGCGRLFEGTPEQMYASLGALSELPGPTRVYCAHEYTLNNLKFALQAEPGNAALAKRMDTTEQLRADNLATVPSTIALELDTNPFLRTQSKELQRTVAQAAQISEGTAVEYFAALRAWKDRS
ncbi:hydroxyacylglutathione hydrolase [Spongiibacter nanhainus]|uniref:Hydroxyacylglutathione hydrolase n=1 Tax=Spongiibacter nanhainus TaxID=2794344 RepID=A0A7T4R407_9GAMM|nr:hydroxyacylglutathione hydrolase [Spongiibacter nanhainus]QQD19922.1 hydroxyacylglutathione hydrolase [Spongiibacter nanhainus]